MKNFRDYVGMYVKGKVDEADQPLKVVSDIVNDRWEVALALSDKGFQQVSFVNSISTTKVALSELQTSCFHNDSYRKMSPGIFAKSNCIPCYFYSVKHLFFSNTPYNILSGIFFMQSIWLSGLCGTYRLSNNGIFLKLYQLILSYNCNMQLQ